MRKPDRIGAIVLAFTPLVAYWVSLVFRVVFALLDTSQRRGVW